MSEQQKLWRDKYKAIYVTPELHQRLAIQAAAEVRQIMEIAEEAFVAYLKSHPIQVSETSESEVAAL